MSISLPLYLLRHRPTGGYIPEPQGKALGLSSSRNGGSWTEPSDPQHFRPRVFRSATATEAFLGQWARGPRGQDGAYAGAEWRHKGDFEIVTLQVEIP